MSAAQPSKTTGRLEAHLHRRARWRGPEIVFWLAVLSAIIVIPSRAALINEILVAGLFALSLDLILGLTGIVSLGQAAFLGLGAYAAAIMASWGMADPTLGLVCGAAVAAVVGLATAPLLLRGSDLTRLMVTLGVSLLLGELANRNGWLTGGADGLNFSMGKVLGLFPIGFTGQRNAAVYSFVVLFVLFAAARRLAQSPFGLALAAIRENRLRAGALGIATSRRIVAIYAVSAAYAGAAGALLAQTTQIVSLDLFDFPRSADVMLMLIIGGAGYLYGGLIGAAVFIFLRDVFSAATPEYWEFWIGALLIALVLIGTRARSRRRHGHRFARRFSPSARGHGVSAPVLEARSLQRQFGALLATDNVSFSIAAGARQALIGPNGAGKTTLINLLTGIIKPSEGQVFLQGRDVTALSANERVRLGLSRTFQINQLFPHLSPAESLGLAISERNGSGPRGAADQHGATIVGRRTADAGDRPGLDAEPAPASARRADRGLGADHRRRIAGGAARTGAGGPFDDHRRAEAEEDPSFHRSRHRARSWRHRP